MSVNEKMTAIADAIRSKTGGTEKLGLDAMASSIGDVFENGYSNGFSSGYSDGYDNGHGSGYSVGYDEGYQSYENEISGDLEDQTDLIAQIGEAVKGKVLYDAFWDTYQENGNKQDYSLAFGGSGWSQGNLFKPKYKIYPTNVYRMFESSFLTDLSKVNMDFSRCSQFVQPFANSKITKLGVIDTRSATYIGYLLNSATQLVSVEKVILKDDGSQQIGNTGFASTNSLQDISFGGTFGDTFSFQQSANLSNVSVQNIINALKSGVSGKVVTFHPNVKNKLTDAQKAQITSKGWTLA